MKMKIQLDNFLFKDKGKASDKLESFLRFGKDTLHLVLDFDRTLTKSQNKAGENITTWEFLRTYLQKDGQKKYQKFYEKYRSLEVRNKMNLSDAVTWWEGILNLFKESNLKWSDIAIHVAERMPIRPGSKELFDVCKSKEIPTIIISAGIRDVIELWCQRFDIAPTIILSTNLIFSSKGYIAGWEKDSLVHVLNKKEKAHSKVDKIRKLRPNTILIGDSLDDASMVERSEDVLRVMIDDPRIDGPERNDNFYDNVFQKFDLVLKDQTLYPVIEIINLF